MDRYELLEAKRRRREIVAQLNQLPKLNLSEIELARLRRQLSEEYRELTRRLAGRTKADGT